MFEAFDKELDEYIGIRSLARGRQYPDALAKVKESQLPESTRDYLAKVLDSGEDFVVDRTLEELDGRIAQALCWGCWHIPDIKEE
jgi:hypothetical protein